MGNNPVRFTDPTGEFIPQLIGGVFNAGVGAAVTYLTDTEGKTTWQQYLRNAAIDFGVGALSVSVRSTRLDAWV